MWDLPGPGIEPMSPVLAGGFLTTVPPGKSLIPYILSCDIKKTFAERNKTVVSRNMAIIYLET